MSTNLYDRGFATDGKTVAWKCTVKPYISRSHDESLCSLSAKFISAFIT